MVTGPDAMPADTSNIHLSTLSLYTFCIRDTASPCTMCFFHSFDA